VTSPWRSSNAWTGGPTRNNGRSWRVGGTGLAFSTKRHTHDSEALLAGTAGRAASARRAATDVLGSACDSAQDLDATPLLIDIDDLARRARLSVGATGLTDRRCDDQALETLDLTPREQEVLTLLARGKSNGDIAKDLFISTKTASVHVSNILRKVNVTNRIEAAAVAIQRHTTKGV